MDPSRVLQQGASSSTVVALAVAIAALAVACSGAPLQGIRKATYPPDFHYITRGEIRGTMQGLASELTALDAILSRDGGPTLEDRDAVIDILSRMRDLASNLKQREHSNHPRIDAFAPRLRHDIVRGLGGARANPPNYYFAGRISGSCSYCHAGSASQRVAIPGAAPAL